MHIVVLTTSYPRHADDWAGHFVRGFARYLADRGHDVSVVAAGDGARREAEEEGLRVVRIPGRGLFYGDGAPETLATPSMWTKVPIFVAQMASEAMKLAGQADAVVSHWLLPSALVGAAIARDRPHVAISHSGDIALLERLPMRETVARILSATGARPVFVSQSLRDRFLALCDVGARRILTNRSMVCSMGIDVHALRSQARVSRAGHLQVLFLGRLVAIKGVRVLARAVAGMRGVTLHVAGDGPERVHLGDAVLHGPVNHARKLKLLNESDVVVLPSLEIDGRTEGAPTVLMEAMAAGLPVVASRSGGIDELVRDGETGILVPPGDVDALRHALERLRDNPDLRQKLGAAAADRAMRFDWAVVGGRLLEVIERPRESASRASYSSPAV